MLSRRREPGDWHCGSKRRPASLPRFRGDDQAARFDVERQAGLAQRRLESIFHRGIIQLDADSHLGLLPASTSDCVSIVIGTVLNSDKKATNCPIATLVNSRAGNLSCK